MRFKVVSPGKLRSRRKTGHKVTHRLGSTLNLDDLPIQPNNRLVHDCRSSAEEEFQGDNKFAGSARVMLSKQTQHYSFTLRELISLNDTISHSNSNRLT